MIHYHDPVYSSTKNHDVTKEDLLRTWREVEVALLRLPAPHEAQANPLALFVVTSGLPQHRVAAVLSRKLKRPMQQRLKSILKRRVDHRSSLSMFTTIALRSRCGLGSTLATPTMWAELGACCHHKPAFCVLAVFMLTSSKLQLSHAPGLAYAERRHARIVRLQKA